MQDNNEMLRNKNEELEQKGNVDDWINTNKNSLNAAFANEVFDFFANAKEGDSQIQNIEEFVGVLVEKDVAIDELLDKHGEKIIGWQKAADQISLYEALLEQYVKIDDNNISSDERKRKCTALDNAFTKHKTVLQQICGGESAGDDMDKVKPFSIELVDALVDSIKNMRTNSMDVMLRPEQIPYSYDSYKKYLEFSQSFYESIKRDNDSKITDACMIIMKNLLTTAHKFIKCNLEVKSIGDHRNDALIKSNEDSINEIQEIAKLYSAKLLSVEVILQDNIPASIFGDKLPEKVLKEICSSGRLMRLFVKHFISQLHDEQGKIQGSAVKAANGYGNYNAMRRFLAVCSAENIEYIAIIAAEVEKYMPNLKTGFIAKSGETLSVVGRFISDSVFFPIIDFLALVFEYIGTGMKWAVVAPYDYAREKLGGAHIERDYNVYRSKHVEEFCNEFMSAMHGKVMRDDIGGYTQDQPPQEQLNDAIVTLLYDYKYSGKVDDTIECFQAKLDAIKCDENNEGLKNNITELKGIVENRDLADNQKLKQLVKAAKEILEGKEMSNRIEKCLPTWLTRCSKWEIYVLLLIINVIIPRQCPCSIIISIKGLLFPNW